MFIALSQDSKSAKFLQTDERPMEGTHEKKGKSFTRICYVCLGDMVDVPLNAFQFWFVFF